MSVIDLIGLDKAAVLAALYNASRPLGMGFVQYDEDQPFRGHPEPRFVRSG